MTTEQVAQQLVPALLRDALAGDDSALTDLDILCPDWKERGIAMRRVSDLTAYQSPWLRGDDLQGRTVSVTVGAVDVESIRQRDGSKEDRLVVSFQGKSKRLILNKTQSSEFVQATGTDVFAQWVGKRVVLAPETARNGKPTIAVRPAQLVTLTIHSTDSCRQEDQGD